MVTYRDVLDEGGFVARKRAGYERRVEQLAMAAEIDAAIRGRRILAIEAGTGVGKSFAYLVPAILYSVGKDAREYDPNDPGFDPSDLDDATDAEETDDADAAAQEDADEGENESADEDDEFDDDFDDEFDSRGERSSLVRRSEGREGMRRVVVSTHTISLQEQIFQKDAPFLNSILPFEFTVALAKGRANYVCRRRYASAKENAAKGTLLGDECFREFQALDEWLAETTDGSKSDLDAKISGDVWNEISCEVGNCLRKKCPYHETCFYQKAKARLSRANIIVVNHALLFSDLAVRGAGGSILPNYDVLIIDEAHTIEQVAAEQLGIEIRESSVEYMLSRLVGQSMTKGLLVKESSDMQNAYRELFQRAAELTRDCAERAKKFFAEALEWYDARPGSAGRVFDKEIVGGGLSAGLCELDRALRRAAETLEDPARRQEYDAARMRVLAVAETIENWRQQSLSGYVYWLEKSTYRGRARIALCAAPIDVAPILRERLFLETPATIVTSATLTVTGSAADARHAGANSHDIPLEPIATGPDADSDATRKAFHFFRSRVGLSGISSARALGSPYNFREQMTLTLVKGLEIPVGSGDMTAAERAAANERRLCAALRDYVDETEGGAFVLFTNAAQMKRVGEALEPYFAEKNYPFFTQSSGMHRQKMIELFKESDHGTLFGVDSFWQGVDVPGQALRNVIIVKLPFAAPEQPLVEARMEAIRERGGNDFREYLLPTAILKFKQGVGRLVRTKTDRGMVVVLDERVITKSYGRAFLSALPDCRLRIDTYR